MRIEPSESAISKEINLTGSQLLALRRPCIYAWYRGDTCLYVGQCKRGMCRIIGQHHLINRQWYIQPIDHFVLFFVEMAPDTSLSLWELYFIDKLKPTLNKVRKPYNEKTRKSQVRTLSKGIRKETGMAKVLQCEMQDGSILGNASNSKDLSKLTESELMARIERCQSYVSLMKNDK